jgi:hypothetical protein
MAEQTRSHGGDPEQGGMDEPPADRPPGSGVHDDRRPIPGAGLAVQGYRSCTTLAMTVVTILRLAEPAVTRG